MHTDENKLDLILNNMTYFKKSQDEMKKELIGLNDKTHTLSINQQKMNEELHGLNERTFILSVGQHQIREEQHQIREEQHQIREELHSLTNTTNTFREEFYIFRQDTHERFNEISSTLTRLEEEQTKDIEAILEKISVKLDERDQSDSR
ncbi:hypothetical protein ACFVAD_01945 [Sutcliffiella sp. NPDC057660]|uniref:hypothetical protein n=1 Tax=Sutcliffiella sp. NPDC057660 TaxID=3346199 RepID=UPI0036B0F526